MKTTTERYNAILSYWFGKPENADQPDTERTHLWFGADGAVDKKISEEFAMDLQNAREGKYDSWKDTPHGALALIILLDQFSRKIHREDPEAYAQDQQALDVCLNGMKDKVDHELSLIERVFFYMPMVHTESLQIQYRALHQYQLLASLSLPELKAVFDNFMEYSLFHYKIVERFGRFPDRNTILGRQSTSDEEEFLKQMEY